MDKPKARGCVAVLKAGDVAVRGTVQVNKGNSTDSKGIVKQSPDDGLVAAKQTLLKSR